MIRPFLPLCKLLFLAISCLSVNGVTRESDLLLRWSFDEGSGSNSQNLIGTGLDVILHPGVTWGNEANGTAKSGYSLDLSSGTSRASVIHDARLQASNDFSILFWFKSNGTPEDFAQLLSKREGTFSSYFVQIDPNGGSLKLSLENTAPTTTRVQSPLPQMTGTYWPPVMMEKRYPHIWTEN